MITVSHKCKECGEDVEFTLAGTTTIDTEFLQMAPFRCTECDTITKITITNKAE